MTGIMARIAGGMVTGLALLVSMPASAQFSDGYKFLEAVKKRNGGDALAALNEPGNTIINARDLTNGQTGLHLVVERRDLVWVQFLLENGANPNLRDRQGVTPLELAVSLQFIEAVEELVKRGANVDETNATGETPLITATHLRDEELAKVLLAAGANPDKADSSGRSARDYAMLESRTNPVLALIQKADSEGKGTASYGPSLR